MPAHNRRGVTRRWRRSSRGNTRLSADKIARSGHVSFGVFASVRRSTAISAATRVSPRSWPHPRARAARARRRPKPARGRARKSTIQDSPATARTSPPTSRTSRRSWPPGRTRARSRGSCGSTGTRSGGSASGWWPPSSTRSGLRVRVPIIRPCWSGGLLIFVDDSGDAVVSAGAEGV